MPDNVVFICVDSLRQDFVRSDATDTPFIDSLVEEGIEYTDMFSTASTTTPAVASLLTGNYSERHGIHWLKGRLGDDAKTLAEILSEQGWYTFAMVTGPLFESTGLDRGFDYYWYRNHNYGLLDSEWAETDWREIARKKVESILTTDSTPFFLYLHLWELHKPLEVPEAYDSKEYGQTEYGRTLSALDRELQSFLDLFPSHTTVILHGDHGESITRRHSRLRRWLKSARDTVRYDWGIDTRKLERACNLVFRSRNRGVHDHYIEDGHDETVYEYTTNVPFVVHGDVEADTVTETCRQIDVLPTVLDYLDVEYGTSVDGETLLPTDTVQSRPAYVRACGVSLRDKQNWVRGIRHENHKYVEYPYRDWPPELYDLSESPQELRPTRDDALSARMERMLPDDTVPKDREFGVRETHEEIDARLRELGYK